MSIRDTIRIFAFLSIIVLAGCSGVLPGQDSDATTPTPGQERTATPTATPAPAATPTSTPRPTPTVTPTPTATPTPSYLNYDSYASQMDDVYDNYPPRGFLYDTGGLADDHTVSVTVRKPEDWTVQDAEMEAARDLARTAAVSTHPTLEAAKNKDGFLRPNTYRVRVVNQEGTLLSETTFDGDTAAAYANGDVTITEFATHTAQRRTVYTESATISKREPTLALRAAEYRPLQYHHLERIANGSFTETPAPEIGRAVILPEEETLYYENMPPNNDILYNQEGIITRTYLEAIKDIEEGRRVNRYPSKVRVFSDVSYVRDESVLTRLNTQWAFNYFVITDWTLPQNIYDLPAEALDAYYNKIERNRKLIRDDDDYDYVTEVRGQEGNDLNATVHDAYVLVEDDE